MKTYRNFWALCVVAWMMLMTVGAERAQAQPGASVSFQTFYDELEPYGRWINDPEYGYVWAPEVDRDFQPYATRGHWVMTEYGNTWMSDYDWGWAPFHYGRWHYDNYYGWLWVPGNEWGPAWVAWRSGGGYYGWTPLGPRMAINISINIPAARWFFVPQMYITSPRVYTYCVPRTTVINVYHNTTYINNYYERDNRRYVYGPRTKDIERSTNRRVQVYNVNDDNRPGRARLENNSVRIYRPQVADQRGGAPSRITERSRENTSRSSLATNNRSNEEVRTRTRGTNVNANVSNESRVGRSRDLSRESNSNGMEPRQRAGIERANQGASDVDYSGGRASRSNADRGVRESYPQANDRVQREEPNYRRQRAASTDMGSTGTESSYPQRSEGTYQRERTQQSRSMDQSGRGEVYQRQSTQREAPVQSREQRVQQSSPRQMESQPAQRESSRESGGRSRRN